MYVEELTPCPDPVDCAGRLAGWPWRLYLDSALRDGPYGRYSFLMADPVAVVRSHHARTERTDDPAGSGLWREVAGDPLKEVRRLLAAHAVSPVAGLPPFQGGAAGYLTYEWGRAIEPRLGAARFDDLGLQDVVLGLYDWTLAWDHAQNRAWLISTGLPETDPDSRTSRAAGRARRVLEYLADGTPRPASTPTTAVSGAATRAPRTWRVECAGWDPDLELRSSFSHAGYVAAVSRVREYILAGDIFQANLSQRIELPLAEPPWEFYRRLRTRNAAPFAAFLEFGDVVVMSASPERFLRADVTGRVETRPIKGTRPRGTGPEHDAALGQALMESEKDRAENLMIVDLMRNDLSRVCRPGSVRVEQLFALERYASVHHLVSTVVGQLVGGTDPGDLLHAAFPGGSITGAPKIRAMEIIAELEPTVRGVYCGAIGYWSRTGALDMSIAIRTALLRNGRLYFNAGGGIVADSDPEQEYQETLDKARGIINALPTSA
jgi:para-aminobenzoate synthetase component I